MCPCTYVLCALCWISEGVLLCVSHRHTQQLRPVHPNTWWGELHKTQEHIQCEHAELTLWILALVWGFFLGGGSCVPLLLVFPLNFVAYSEMLLCFWTSHLFSSKIPILRSWWCEIMVPLTWVLATSFSQSLLFSSQQMVFYFSFWMWQRNIGRRQIVYFGTWGYTLKPIITFCPIIIEILGLCGLLEMDGPLYINIKKMHF